MKPRNILRFALGVGLAANGLAQTEFDARVRAIMARPDYQHSRFGLAIYPAGGGNPLYRLNAEQLFIPASTTKLVSEGVALKLIGPGYRFHTPIYRTGTISPEGVLLGDLVVVASGDLNLSGRIRPDGTLAFLNVDHSYSGTPGSAALPGDPIAPLRKMARQVADHGVKRVTGRVIVDVSLFPEGERELGTGAVISPIVINDNCVDMTIAAGVHEGDPGVPRLSPETSYIEVTNHVRTVAAGAQPQIRVASDVRNADGSRRLTVEGTIPAGHAPFFHSYKVPEPAVFASFLFREVLAEAGVTVVSAESAKPLVDWQTLAAWYKPENLEAEHVSPPLSEDARITLKVSQNLHASTIPYLVGVIAGGKHPDALAEGFRLERQLLEKDGLDLSGAVQADGAGGSALFTPDFMCQFLTYMAKQPFAQTYHDSLPVLGKDGTLYDIQNASAAAGKVFAKTGTLGAADRLHGRTVITGKGLAGYMTTRDGHDAVFAFYVNFVPADPVTGAHIVGDMLGEISTAAYESDWGGRK
ncbi:MAG TPA: D-alanyl-D-alanine carboxypeptidase/D-alanyl-D-alanine-endopeptidase [Bryobacteraceae bacterium]|nr:D-alanyl-D-alanine carboxypeptidase/D-alanyl-D-alanine-endopeptidase [Bryobacteraceae bacterium]